MRIRLVVVHLVPVLLVLFCCCSEVRALVAFDRNYNFNFRFNNPGARANALGGAFIGLADDATTAYTNPAGLTILRRPEISLEYKAADYENTEYGPAGAAYDFDEEGNGLSFASLVFPWKEATLAVYRHQLINITSDYRLPPRLYTAETDITAATYGIAAGLEVLPDHLSLGLAVGFSQLDYYYTSEVFADQSLANSLTIKYLVDQVDTAEHYTLSLLWNAVGGLNIGLVYRQGPEFGTTLSTLFDSNTDGLFESSQSAKNTLKVPDVYGLGLAYQFDFGLSVAMDVNRVLYSDLVQDFVFRTGQTEFSSLQASDYTVDDQTEYHFGFEYVIDMQKALIALRGGYYTKPEHRIRYVGPDADQQKLARKGEDDAIYAFGAGVSWSELQVDAAARIGDFEKEYTLSFVYRFD